MTDVTNTRITLARRPQGAPVAQDFHIEQGPVPQQSQGQVLLKILYLSLDPYMRGRMSTAKSYAKPVEIGDGAALHHVAEVVASNHADFKPGDIVLSHSGWQAYALSDGKGLRKLDPQAAPVSTALGVLGMPGFTAYAGLLTIGQPKPNETVVVAAASGAVGSVVGQIARIKGARAVGVAGGPDKCAFLRDELGFDVAVDHRAPDFAERLKAACPGGIDVYFENVGGHVFEAVFPLLNTYARVPVCGLIAQYNQGGEAPSGPDRLPGFMREVLSRSLQIRGFIQYEFNDQRDTFLKDAAGWIAEGRLRYREDVVDGLENAPQAFIGLLEGRNFGKLVIKVA